MQKTKVSLLIYVPAGMDISAGSVLAGPNLTGRMEPGMKTFRPIIWKVNMFVFPEETFNFLTVLLKMHFSVRNLFQNERVLNSIYMVISEMKTQFYT